MPADRNHAALDGLNFVLADVQGGLGPFLAIFLLTAQHWEPGRIGLVLTIGGLATVLARGPAGALVDAVRWKRSLIGLAAAIVAIAAVGMALAPRFWPVGFLPVALAQLASGAADAVFPIAIAAISLGLFGRKCLAKRIGRNEAFNHAGNIAAAALAGIAAHLIAPGAVLWMIAALAIISAVAAFRIEAKAIDHARACGADEPGQGKFGRHALQLLLTNRPLMMFTIAITLFHFANAAMLPLVGETLAQSNQNASSLFMASCIVVAQIVMVPMALIAGRYADRWGRKPLFLAGFAVLPLRGVLYTLVQDPRALIAVQALDGIGAGIFGVLFLIVVADLTKGTGHYNLVQGVCGAAWGLGAALSNMAAGEIVDAFGYSAAFLFLAGCALLAFFVFLLAVPESRPCANAAARRGTATATMSA